MEMQALLDHARDALQSAEKLLDGEQARGRDWQIETLLHLHHSIANSLLVIATRSA
jgi:hypothetical protein